MQEVEGSTPTGGTCPNDFSDPIHQDICTQWALSWKIIGIKVAVGGCSVTERQRWRPPYQTGKTVHVHAKTLQTERGRTHGAGCVRQWFRTTEPLGERRYENWVTHKETTEGNNCIHICCGWWCFYCILFIHLIIYSFLSYYSNNCFIRVSCQQAESKKLSGLFLVFYSNILSP